MSYVTFPYKPTNGFFNLTEKPKGMSAKTHQKIQKMQMLLISQAGRYKDPKVRQDNQANFEELKELMAKFQQVILINWPHEMLFRGEE